MTCYILTSCDLDAKNPASGTYVLGVFTDEAVCQRIMELEIAERDRVGTNGQYVIDYEESELDERDEDEVDEDHNIDMGGADY